MKKFVLLVAVGLFSALTVYAQEAPRADLSAGYSYFREGFSGGAKHPWRQCLRRWLFQRLARRRR